MNRQNRPVRAFRPLTKNRSITLTLACLLIASALPACGSGPSPVNPIHVSGKITLDGRPWPRPGMLAFEPVDGNGKVAVALFEKDGTFNLTSVDLKEGIYPGRYRISVTCWMVEPTVDETGALRGGKSCVPEPYRQAKTSDLNFSVKPGYGLTEILVDLKTP